MFGSFLLTSATLIFKNLLLIFKVSWFLNEFIIRFWKNTEWF